MSSNHLWTWTWTRTCAAGLLGGLALIAAAGSPARAEVETHVDGRGDVVGVGAELPYEPVPDRADPDVLRVRIDHRSTELLVRVKARDLTPDLGHLVAGRVRTAAGDAAFGWGAKPGRPLRGGYFGAGEHKCEMADPTFNLERDVVRFAVPRSCLGDSTWVRVGVGLSSYTDLDNLYVDDAFSQHVRHESVLGPRLTMD